MNGTLTIRQLAKLFSLGIQILKLVPKEHQMAVMEAIVLAIVRHDDQTDIGGDLHCEHVLMVGLMTAQEMAQNGQFDLAELVAAILHDVVEDTTTTLTELYDLFGSEVAAIVAALTHEAEEESDEVYLQRVAAAGKKTIDIKRRDKIQNLQRLILAPPAFRAQKLMEVRASLPIWEGMDQDSAALIMLALRDAEKADALEKNKGE